MFLLHCGDHCGCWCLTTREAASGLLKLCGPVIAVTRVVTLKSSPSMMHHQYQITIVTVIIIHHHHYQYQDHHHCNFATLKCFLPRKNISTSRHTFVLGSTSRLQIEMSPLSHNQRQGPIGMVLHEGHGTPGGMGYNTRV